MKHIKLFEAFVNEAKSALDLKRVMKEITKKCKHVDGVTISKGNKLTGIKELSIESDWVSLNVKEDGNIYTNEISSTYGGIVKSESELYKFINDIIDEEIKAHKSRFNESKGRLTFKDLEIGDEFLIFGENGQLWVKTSVRQAKFVKNVGKKTAPYYKKYGSLNVFSPTMDVTLPNDTYQ